MNVVIDTSAVLAVLLNEPERKFLLDQTQDCELLAPYSLPWEIGNAISAMFKRKKINLKDAKLIFEIFNEIPIRLCNISIINALEISDLFKMYAYDAYMIECARSYRAPLLTLDLNLIKKAKEFGITLLENEK
jgi:predicted nucleic acid-binding protein